MSVAAARIITSIMVSHLLPSVHLIALIAYERYSFFVIPLRYTQTFTKYRIYTSVIYGIALCVGVGVDLIEPRIAVATSLSYQLQGMTGRISTIFYGVVYFTPSGAVSVLTLVRLRQVISRHKEQGPPLDTINEDQSAVSGVIVKPGKLAMKMVGLMSGSFWLTTLPGGLITLGFAAFEVTWADTDYRTSLSLFVLARASYMMITVLSSFLNPIIYMSVLAELREAVLKSLGITHDNADSHN